MLTRTMVLFAFGLTAVLFGAAPSDAQPGKGGKGPFGKGPFGKGPGAEAEIQKLERDLERLLDQIEETRAKLSRARQAGKGKDDFDFKRKFEGKKGFDFKKGFEGKKDFDFKKWFGGKKGFEGKGPFGKGFDGKKKGSPFPGFPKGDKGGPGGKLDPETIKERYEFYKKLYDELPKSKGKGFEGRKGKGGPGGGGKGGPGGQGRGGPGGGFGSSSSTEARIDALIRELEALRNEIRGAKKK